MQAGLIGMNYKLCNLELRELFTKKAQRLLEEKAQLASNLFLVLLSTCNRTEIYFSADDLAEGHSILISELKKEMGDFADHCLYSYFGEKCFNHLAKVTAGFDSVIFGEAEIQRQVKEAYEKACLQQNLPSSLHFMFQKSLKIGKEIRTTFSLPKSHVSMESTVGDLIRYFYQDQKDLSILFVGFSEINRKIIPFLKGKGFSNLYLITRNVEAAKKMSLDSSCSLLNWLCLSDWPSYNVVISGSLASQYLIRPDQLESCGSEIQNRLVIDLSVPRNVDPLIEKHRSITLFNIEEVNFFVDQKQQGIGKEKEQIKIQIEERVSLQIDLYNSRKNRMFVCA